ncbi:MAG: gliding motility-associated protein GldE [Flavobacteriales bacterium]
MPDPSPIRPLLAHVMWTNTETIYTSIIVFLLILAAVTTSSESAFFSLNPQEKDRLKSENSRISNIILDLLSKPRELIALLLISINFVNVGIVILSTLILNKMMEGYSEVSKLLVEIFGITLLILITGEVIPKIYGANNASKVSRFMALPIDVIRKTPPISWLKSLLVNGTSFIGKIGGKNIRISSDELEQAIAITSDVSSSEDEQKLLEGIVKLGKTEAVQIMTPRIEMSSIPHNIAFSKVIEYVLEFGYSRIPIHQDSADNVIGILYIKDLLPHLKESDDFPWLDLIRKPFFIPENKKIDDLLQEFRGMKMHLAVVVDEYGGASGIVTLEDILEEIVGDITDEFDDDQVEYKKMDDGTYAFEGRTSLKDFYKILEIEGEEFERDKGDSETIGGFMVEQSGRILKNKESLTKGNFKLTVISSDKRRIKWIKVQLL